ncbi:MAG: hypothetical protein KatS3mg101_0181 [Patescibacteria group bacterium]|nr:MAG: hypothetical protein KatS3mg101_0181 [Patescibacteria group bacterium]
MEESKPKKNIIIPTLVTIVIVLGVALLYTALKPTLLRMLKPESTESQTEQTEEQAGQTTTEQLPTEAAGQKETSSQTEGTTPETKPADHSADIDKDLQSLDSLDLSTPENDFGDDKLSGL